VSLKDNFEIHGVDTTVGFVAWAEDPCVAEEQQPANATKGGEKTRGESEMTKIMRNSGAVLFCKT
jgi:amidase